LLGSGIPGYHQLAWRATNALVSMRQITLTSNEPSNVTPCEFDATLADGSRRYGVTVATAFGGIAVERRSCGLERNTSGNRGRRSSGATSARARRGSMAPRAAEALQGARQRRG